MQQPQTNTQKPDANINEAWALFVRVICALACFPHEAFHQLQDWGSKASVLGRGLAVAISPTISAIVLYTYAGVVFGNAAYLLFMPVIVFLIDWQITGRAYHKERDSQLRLVRVVLALITLFISLYASLLSQQESLLKSLRQGEMAALQSAESHAGMQFREIQGQMARTREAIASNSERIRVQGPELKAKQIEAELMQAAECDPNGGGVNALTGKFAIGGRCGPKAKVHKDTAEAARRLIAVVEELKDDNLVLQQELTELGRRMEAIQESVLTTKPGMGSLFKAVRYADLGTVFSIVLSAAMMMFLELLCLIFSRYTPAKNLQDAVADLGERDARRLELYHARTLAKLNQELPPLRFGLADERSSHVAHLSVPASAAKPIFKPVKMEAV